MLHAVTGSIVRREMKKKCVAVELRCSPHRRLGTHDLFEIPNKGWAPAALVSTGMNDDMVSFAVDIEVIHSPIWTDLGGGIDQNLVIGIFPIVLIRPFRSCIHNPP